MTDALLLERFVAACTGSREKRLWRLRWFGELLQALRRDPVMIGAGIDWRAWHAALDQCHELHQLLACCVALVDPALIARACEEANIEPSAKDIPY